MKKVKVCTRCIYNEYFPRIIFNKKGMCNYCIQSEKLEQEYPNNKRGAKILEGIVNDIKKSGKGKQYDCVVGVSGGCDSSYLLFKMKEMGLRPLAAHFDNTWNSSIATENIKKLTKTLDIDLFTHVVDNKEYDDIYLSFLKAGVPDIEAPTDIGLATTLYMAAEKYGIKYIIEGHSFRTEGISPLDWLYMDGKYISDIHKQFGLRKMKTYPNLWLSSFLKWIIINRIKKVRPLYFMDYDKEKAKKVLSKKFNWSWYGGHHLENRFTAFYHNYFLPKRFGFDHRYIELSALIRSKQITREEALRIISVPPKDNDDTVTLVKKRLGLSDNEFKRLMNLPKKNYRNYATYKKTFEHLRWFFLIMYKLDLVPKSFYLKFTVKDSDKVV